MSAPAPRVVYNGADLGGEALLASCVYESHAWGSMDWVELGFADPSGRWGRWAPSAGDVVEASLGPVRTGAMHVTRVRRAGGVVSLRAIAAPPEMALTRWRSWGSVRLHQLIAQVADECGMPWEAHGVDDREYRHVDQAGEGDARFLARRLAMEGASLILFDGRLAAVSGEWMQRQGPAGELSAPAGSRLSLSDRAGRAWGACRVSSGAVSGEFRAHPGPVLARDPGCALSGAPEAARFARGLLRTANREAATARIRGTALVGWLAGGSVADLSVDEAPGWDGPHVAARVRHDLVAARTDATFARFLEGY